MDRIALVITDKIAIALTLDRAHLLIHKYINRSSQPDAGDVVVGFEDGSVILADRSGVKRTAMSLSSVLNPTETSAVLRWHEDLSHIQAEAKRCGALADAGTLVRQLLTEATNLSREKYEKFLRWKGIIAADAYKWVTLASMLLDYRRTLFKRMVRTREPGHNVVSKDYANLIAAMGALTGIACAGPDNDWLTEMALNFPWTTWSPSFVLLRERSVFSALQGATAASAFGERMSDFYLQRLTDASSPLLIFDAVVGLVALAGRSHLAEEISDALNMRMNTIMNREPDLAQSIGGILRSANMVLRSPEKARQIVAGWASLAEGSKTRRSRNEEDRVLRFLKRSGDAVRLIDGHYPSILSIPLYRHTSPEKFFLPSYASEMDIPSAKDREYALLRSCLLTFDEGGETLH